MRKPFSGWLWSGVAFGLALAVLPLLTLLPSTASAATDGFNITTSPLPVQLVTKPGGTVGADLRVQDSGTSPVRLKVNLLKFKADGKTGRPQLLKRQPGDSFFDWVKFSQTSFVAQPGEWNTIRMNITTPPDAAYGYYYAVLFSQDTAGQPPAAPNTGKVNGAAAILVLLDVQAKGEKRQLQAVSFTANKKLYEYLPASFNVTVHNSGNIHLVPNGNIFISRDHKHNLATLDVNKGQGNILPNSNRAFQADWNDGFPVFETKRDHGQIVSDKKGQPIQQLKWDFSKANRLRFGHYYAHLLLTYDNGKQDVPIEAEVGFWVVPWKAIIGFILFVAGLYGLHRWSVKRAVRRAHRGGQSPPRDAA